MARIRSKGNKSTELRFRGLLIRYGLRGWKVQAAEIPGKPDFVFPKQKVAIFVDSCYWHGCRKHVRHPKTKKSYWRAKIFGNIKRDRRVSRLLVSQGWRVLRIWEHDLRIGSRVIERAKELLRKT
jgi:DNA mismatch endonuclease (patch repair protein)